MSLINSQGIDIVGKAFQPSDPRRLKALADLRGHLNDLIKQEKDYLVTSTALDELWAQVKDGKVKVSEIEASFEKIKDNDDMTDVEVAKTKHSKRLFFNP